MVFLLVHDARVVRFVDEWAQRERLGAGLQRDTR